MEQRKLSKAEQKAWAHGVIIPHENGGVYDTTGKQQGVDFEITKDGTITTDKKKVHNIALYRKSNAEGKMIPITEQPPEKQLEIRRKAHAAMKETQRKRKNIQEICNTLLSIQASDIASHVVSPEIADKLKDTDLTLYDLITAKMIEESMHGNVKAAQFVRDSAGDKPIDRQEVTAEVITDADRIMLENIERRLNPGE